MFAPVLRCGLRSLRSVAPFSFAVAVQPADPFVQPPAYIDPFMSPPVAFNDDQLEAIVLPKMEKQRIAEEPVDWMQRLVANFEESTEGGENFRRYAKCLRPTAATAHTATFDFNVSGDLLNGKGTLHGGQIAALVDIVSSMAITLVVRDTPMVSVELSCSFLAPAAAGETVCIEADCIRAGRNIVFAEVTFRNSKGTILARGKHTVARLNHLKNNDGGYIRQ